MSGQDITPLSQDLLIKEKKHLTFFLLGETFDIQRNKGNSSTAKNKMKLKLKYVKSKQIFLRQN